MPDHLSPGDPIDEVGAGPRPIEGVSTSVAGFLGPTERGPEDIRSITSWSEFTRWFGGHMGVDRSFLSYAVQGFFDNGGKRCFVARIVEGAAAGDQSAAVATLTAGSNGIFVAIGRGTWGNNILVRVVPATKAKKNVPAALDWIRIQVLYFSGGEVDIEKIVDPFRVFDLIGEDFRSPDIIEDFDDLSLDRTAPNSVLAGINSGSKLIRLASTSEAVSIAVTNQFQSLNNGAQASKLSLADYMGTPRAIFTADPELLGTSTGLLAMENIDTVSLLCAPDHVNLRELEAALIASCERLKDRLAIFSTPFDFNPSQPDLRNDTTFGALYHPWIWIHDDKTRADQLVPPVGHVAGIIARTDIERGVFSAPANAIVVGAKELHSPITKEIQDLLNPIGVNCIRDFRSSGRGIRLWGARTMSSDPEWRYISVRRLFLYIEESIAEGMRWVVFEPNTEATWVRVRQSINHFLTTIWRAGGLFGARPEQAFFVRCDRTTMNEDDIQNGNLVCEIGISPVRPAEFVIFRISQKTAHAT